MERARFELAQPEKVFTIVFPTGIRQIYWLLMEIFAMIFGNEGEIYEIQNDANENMRRNDIRNRRIRFQSVVFR